MTETIYEINGYINKVTTKSRIEGNYKTSTRVIPAEFLVQTVQGPCYNCVCSFYKPVDEGDVITGKVKLVYLTPTTHVLHFVQDPMVYIPTDPDNLKQCFIRALRTTGFGGVSADRLYDGLAEMTKIDIMMKSIVSLDDIKLEPEIIEVKGLVVNNPIDHLLSPVPQFADPNKKITSDEIIAYLTDLGVQFHLKNDKAIPENLSKECNVKIHQATILLQWWYKERSLRRLHLLGLTNEEIKECHMSLDDIYLICIGDGKRPGNPFKLPPISMEKCYAIMKFINIIPSPIEVTCGQVVRRIYENLNKFGWTCTPIWALQRQFQNFYSLRDILIREYDVTIEYESAYLKYPYKVESTVSHYINSLIKNTAERLNELPLEDLPHMETAYYHCKTLTEEQKIAVQAALSHDICIITGGSGTGKCLAPDTPVLMYDGKIKLVKDIIVHDQLMGTNSSLRTVLGTTEGVGNMYEITPQNGRSFSCNGEHILTLKGLTPRIEFLNNQYIVKYSVNGEMTNQSFYIKDCALLLLKSLGEDIFDISLYDFMSKSEFFKENVFLFHEGVNFPEKDLGFLQGPYSFGLLLAEKHRSGTFTSIPSEYKINSRDNRLMLLAGILDGDYHSSKKFYSINTTSKKFVDEVEYLAFSLGLMVSWIAIQGGYSVLIYGQGIEEIPVVLSKKVIDNRDSTKQKFTVNYLGISKFNGFELDGNGRFLLGDFTVSHNSTIIAEIARNLKLRECVYAIGSPTGKSASRVNEILNIKSAQTLDRMIMKSKGVIFPYLIIDETSMVTTELFYRFITTFAHNFRVIIVGDINQLQPIGWGSFMKSLIYSKRIPIYYLTYNHRIVEHITSSEEMERKTQLLEKRGEVAPGLEKFDRIILENANNLIAPGRNMSEPLVFNQGKGFSIINGGVGYVHTIVATLAKAGVSADDISILSPFNQFIPELNEVFRQVYYPNVKFMVDVNKNIWYPGARVMMLVNNYDINIMNGEEGIVQLVNDAGVQVKFKDSSVHVFKFNRENTKWKARGTKNLTDEGEALDRAAEEDTKELLVEHLQVSFAISVHKSQGSEVQYILFYIPARYGNGKLASSAMFLNVNLLYTGITRVKKAIWIVGDEVALMQATCRVQAIRYENLCPRLVGMKDKDREGKIESINAKKGLIEDLPPEYDDLPEEEDLSMYTQHYAED